MLFRSSLRPFPTRHTSERSESDSCGKMTHLELVGAVHGPPSEEIIHHSRFKDFLSETGQPGTSTVFIGSDRTWLGVEALVCVDLEHELALDGRDRR